MTYKYTINEKLSLLAANNGSESVSCGLPSGQFGVGLFNSSFVVELAASAGLSQRILTHPIVGITVYLTEGKSIQGHTDIDIH